MNDLRPKILIIEDSVAIIKMLIEVLKPHYHVFFARDGAKGIDMVSERNPDLVLLDIKMEPMDGYQVCIELKNNPVTADTPIIFLTAASDYMDEAKGFQLGAADYITKPFVPMVVLARIRLHLKLAQSLKELQRLYKLALDSNPITQLPGNNSIHQHIDNLLAENRKQHVLYIDLDNFKSFNDKYGFAKGDEVIKFTADLLVGLMQELQITDGFIGHIGGDDFMVTVGNSDAMDYINGLLNRFERQIIDFYTKEDAEAGHIRMKNRQGVTVDFPIISLSVVGVNLSFRDYPNYLYISDICAELKHHAKSIPGSTVLIDRRTS